MQDIAELSKTEIEGGNDTLGVYLLLVTHKRLEQTESYKELNKKKAQINLAEKLRFLTLPEYGYYQNRLFMAAVAFALRPYIDRMYTSGTGQRIDKTVMKVVRCIIDRYKNQEDIKYS